MGEATHPGPAVIASAGLALTPDLLRGLGRRRVGDPYNRDIAEAALDAAQRAGADVTVLNRARSR
ncbi:MAG: hypothetical protein O2958_10745 [Gemmatimonadetes bacterium]|nr:hypothetical protein [Gemmatimonadota bacterium]